jgi:hypothetical protein
MTDQHHHVVSDDGPSQRQQAPSHNPGMLALLFKLSLAAALPPDAIMAPPSAMGPTIHPSQAAILAAEALTTSIGRTVVAAGSGRVFLREVDQRLDGLVVRLDTYRVPDEPGMLVSIGLVTPDPEHGARQRATVRDLWFLANSALITHGVPCEHVLGIGDDAFLALHGGQTAQVAWLTTDRLATVSVTSLRGDSHWAMATARSLARLAGEHLAPEDAWRTRLSPRTD